VAYFKAQTRYYYGNTEKNEENLILLCHSWDSKHAPPERKPDLTACDIFFRETLLQSLVKVLQNINTVRSAGLLLVSG
jgi:hypothetical protein